MIIEKRFSVLIWIFVGNHFNNNTKSMLIKYNWPLIWTGYTRAALCWFKLMFCVRFNERFRWTLRNMLSRRLFPSKFVIVVCKQTRRFEIYTLRFGKSTFMDFIYSSHRNCLLLYIRENVYIGISRFGKAQIKCTSLLFSWTHFLSECVCLPYAKMVLVVII